MACRRLVPSPCGACPDMHLRCVNCQHVVSVPDGFGRYFHMPVRCHACRRVFTVPPRRPIGGATPTSPPGRRLDRSLSARRNHHLIRCPACAAALRLAGQSLPLVPVRLVCPHCGSGFRHRPHRHADGLDVVMLFVGGAVLALGLVLLAQVGGYIELRNLATAPALGRLGEFLDAQGIR